MTGAGIYLRPLTRIVAGVLGLCMAPMIALITILTLIEAWDHGLSWEAVFIVLFFAPFGFWHCYFFLRGAITGEQPPYGDFDDEDEAPSESNAGRSGHSS